MLAVTILFVWLAPALAEDSKNSKITPPAALAENLIEIALSDTQDLSTHGKRFELAIQAIARESQKPLWYWGD